MTDESESDLTDDLPDLYAEFDDDGATADAELIQAKALCRMAAIQQFQLELQYEEQQYREEMREQMQEMFSELEDFDDMPFGDDSGTDQFRYDPPEDDDFDYR